MAIEILNEWTRYVVKKLLAACPPIRQELDEYLTDWRATPGFEDALHQPGPYTIGSDVVVPFILSSMGTESGDNNICALLFLIEEFASSDYEENRGLASDMLEALVESKPFVLQYGQRLGVASLRELGEYWVKAELRPYIGRDGIERPPPPNCDAGFVNWLRYGWMLLRRG